MTKEAHISSEYFHRTVWRPWAKHFILNVLFALIVEKSLPTLHSIWKTDCPTAKKIGMNCSQPNVSPVAFQSKPVTVGWRLLTTIIIVNALIAHYAKRTSKEKDSLSRLASHFAKAMPGWESKIWHSTTNKTKSKAIPVYRNVGIFSLKTSHLLSKNKQDFSWLIKIFSDWSWRNMMKQVCEETKKMCDFLFTYIIIYYTVHFSKKKRNLLTNKNIKTFVC